MTEQATAPAMVTATSQYRLSKISGMEYGKALSDLGLIPPKTQRMVLDFTPDGVLLVVFETIGGEEWLSAGAMAIAALMRDKFDAAEAERRKPIEEQVADLRAKLDNAIARYERQWRELMEPRPDAAEPGLQD